MEDTLMRKRTIETARKQDAGSGQKWLDVENLAIVEISSENSEFPVESALLPGNCSGWRAADPGKQIIRVLFDSPQRLQWIRLSFEELETERTQEFVLRWSEDGGRSYQEILRQQWNFSPEGASSEIENYQVELPAVTILELRIDPDISGRNAFASLKELRLA